MTEAKNKLSELLPVYKDMEGTVTALKIINKALHEKVNEDDWEDDSKPYWTKKITEIMATIMPRKTGNGYTLNSYSHSHDGDSRRKIDNEYMIDHAWSYEIGNGDYDAFYGLALAMEVEWIGTVDSTWTDFYKLADIKADLKIFLTSLQVKVYEEEREKLIKTMVKFLSNHIHFANEEKILVIFWNKSTKPEGLNTSPDYWNTSYIVGKNFLEKLASL